MSGNFTSTGCSTSEMEVKVTAILVLTLIVTGCQKQQDDYLIKVYQQGGFDEAGVRSGYINLKGDTVLPAGKYQYCYTDTVREFAIVTEKKGKTIGIDQNENKLFEVFWFDNGPDPVVEGLFRIIKDGKIGFADQKGKIVIAARYTCAYPFENGKAKVAYQCETIPEGEYTRWESQTWMYIDEKGNEIESGLSHNNVRHIRKLRSAHSADAGGDAAVSCSLSVSFILQ
jgi:hypothetical protein